VSNADDGPQISVNVVNPEKRTFLLRAPDAQSHAAWIAILTRVIDSMKRKAMPEAYVEVAEDGLRVFDLQSSQMTAFFKITRLRQWKATQTHLHVCVDVNKQPENHLYRTEHAGTFAKALNKAAKIAAKNPGLSTSTSMSQLDVRKDAAADIRNAPQSPRAPHDYYADEGDNYDEQYAARKAKTRSLETPQRQAKQQTLQHAQHASANNLHQRSDEPLAYYDEPVSEAPRAPPPALLSPPQLQPQQRSAGTLSKSAQLSPQPRAGLSQSMSSATPAPLAATTPGGELMARALYDYAPKDETRLAMNRGDVLHVVKEVDEHWYRCQLGQKKGIVPRTYVRLVENDIVAVAIADFDDGDEKHLRFDKGEEVIVLTRVETSDWWDGVVQVTNERGESYRRTGIFPIQLVEIATSSQAEFNRVSST
jgi:hypothetical protein